MTRVYRLNYVRSDELLAMIRPFLSVDVGQKRVSVTPSYRFGIGESATFVSGGAGAAAAGGGGASTANTGGPTNQGASGGGSTVGRLPTADRRKLDVRQRPADHPGL